MRATRPRPAKRARRIRDEWTCPFCLRLIEFGERFHFLVEWQRFANAENTFPGIGARSRAPDFFCRRCRASIEDNQRAKHEEELAMQRDMRVIGRVFAALFAGLVILIAWSEWTR